MQSLNGTIVLNGITDKELELVWAHKAKHENSFTFSPNVMQPTTVQNKPAYNNVSFGYNNVHSLNLITELANELHKRQEEAKVAAQ